jgi:hypothetical protein
MLGCDAGCWLLDAVFGASIASAGIEITRNSAA